MVTQDIKIAEWYAVRVHSGFEMHVSKALNQAIDSLGLKDKILEILVPTEKKVRLKGGKRVEFEERIYPGFVLINMIVDKETWAVVHNTEHVTGFAGSRTQAEPLSQEEMDNIRSRMNSDVVKHEMDVAVGMIIRIIDGPFKGQEGRVSEIDTKNGQAVVEIGMFGQQASTMRLKLDLFQIEGL